MVDVVKSMSSKCTVLEPPALLRKHVRAPPHSHVTQSGTWNNATVKAIARAFRGREMLENGTHGTIGEIACREAFCPASFFSMAAR